jgi:uncharacterized damage-inducible protein DinB
MSLGKESIPLADHIEELAVRLERALHGLIGKLNGISDAELYTPPADGEWSVAQVCAHVVEMEVLWMSKAASLAEQPEIGRTQAEVERRTAEIAAHARDPLGTIVQRLRNANGQALHTLRDMRPADLDQPGTLRGPVTGRQVIERVVIEHIEEHAAQIADARHSA